MNTCEICGHDHRPKVDGVTDRYIEEMANCKNIVSKITREITRHPDAGAYFVSYTCRINSRYYNYGDFVEANPLNCSKELDEETLRTFDLNALQAFKRSGSIQSNIEIWKST